ncbi:MAG: hypothetical protein NVSMB34_11920 [Variovorax sp.]
MPRNGQSPAEKTVVDDVARNWYFTLATYLPTGDGYHRREKECASIFGVMLDDLGSKAQPRERLDACPPSYLIETSPGNYQAGYLFDAPQTDIARVSALNQSLVEAGLCDPGAKSPATRYGRLPFASNGKSHPAFECRLVEWHPERRYSIEEIVERLDLSPPQALGQQPLAGRRAEAIDRNAEDVYVPRAEENAVMAALRERGLYKRRLGSGKHDITCPWRNEHTDQVDHGSVYFEPSDLYPVGGFKCQHSHGDTRKIGALLEYLNVTVIDAKHKSKIRVVAGELHRVVDTAEHELAKTGDHYQRGGLIVAVQTDPGTHATTVKAVTANSLMRVLSAAAIWERFDGRTMDFLVTDPPVKHVNVLFESDAYRHLPVLQGIARQPYLRADGSLMTAAGYDPGSCMFGAFDARAFNVPARPTQVDARAALDELDELLSEFGFARPHDRAAALAAILTAAIRPALALAPMFHVKAPQIASGKSYLCSLIAAFAGPGRPAVYGFPTNEEECAKLLLSALLEAPAVVTFDNLTSDLIAFKVLCSALTEEYLTGRILGVSKTATVGTRTLFLSSGNNVGPVRDMTRRTVTIALDPKCETPAARDFKADPVGRVQRERGRFVSLALAVVRAYVVAGSPPQNFKALGSYGEWSRMVRAPLVWLGQPDPATAIFEGMAEDPDREMLGRLLTAWRESFGSAPTTIRALIDKTQGAFKNPELADVLHEIAEERGEINRRRLGRWIARHKERIVDGHRFERDTKSGGSERWRVVVTRVSGVSVSQVGKTVHDLIGAHGEVPANDMAFAEAGVS